MKFLNTKVAVIVAHSDDEAWGILGTILRLKKEFNAQITIIMVSDSSRGSLGDKSRVIVTEKLCKALKLNMISLGFLDGYLEGNKVKIIGKLDKIFQTHQFDIIFTHYDGDNHQDHKTVFDCVIASLRNHPTSSLLQFETPFKTGFVPNFYINISRTVEKKIDFFCEFYNGEISKRKELSEDTILLVARYRGLESGYNMAEAFKLIRGILE